MRLLASPFTMEPQFEFIDSLINLDVIRVQDIPRGQLNSMANPDAGNMERFNNFRFLINNGVAPPIAGGIVAWYALNGYLPQARAGGVIRHVNQMIRESETGIADPTSRFANVYFGYPHWDMIQNRVYDRRREL